MLTLTLPWPPSGLSPNARHGHWAQLAHLKRRFRTACSYTARTQGAARLDTDRLAVHLRFFPPDRRRRDLDNCIASMKAGLDGLADVLGVDDSRWRLSAEIPVDGAIGGFVKVEVSPWPG
jgi:crossover junction endodeoxyribonuclease RusA